MPKIQHCIYNSKVFLFSEKSQECFVVDMNKSLDVRYTFQMDLVYALFPSQEGGEYELFSLDTVCGELGPA